MPREGHPFLTGGVDVGDEGPRYIMTAVIHQSIVDFQWYREHGYIDETGRPRQKRLRRAIHVEEITSCYNFLFNGGIERLVDAGGLDVDPGKIKEAL